MAAFFLSPTRTDTHFHFPHLAGSYGSVGLAFDHKLKKRVAIKKINDVFHIFENAKRYVFRARYSLPR